MDSDSEIVKLINKKCNVSATKVLSDRNLMKCSLFN